MNDPELSDAAMHVAVIVKRAFEHVPKPERLQNADTCELHQNAIRTMACRDWRNVDSDLLIQNKGAFYSFSAEAFRYYLPALLLAAVPPSSPTNPKTDRRNPLLWPAIAELLLNACELQDIERGIRIKLDRFELLNQAQNSAVQAFLEFAVASSQDDFIRYHAALALQRFWNRAGTDSDPPWQKFLASLTEWARPRADDGEAEVVIREIEHAFNAAPYPGDKQITGCREDFESADIELEFCGTDWRRLHPSFLRLHSAALSFFTPEAMRYYLPAYLIGSLLRSCGGLEFHLVDPFVDPGCPHCAWAQGKYGALNRKEREAVISYLRFQLRPLVNLKVPKFLEADPERLERWHTHLQKEHRKRTEQIAAALESYWIPSVDRPHAHAI